MAAADSGEISAQKVNVWGAIIFWRSKGEFHAPAEGTEVKKFNEKLGGITVIHVSSAFQFTGMPTLGRGSAKEMLVFISREVVRRTKYDATRLVRHEGHLCACTVDESGLAATVLCAENYPEAAALNLMARVMRLFKEESGPLLSTQQPKWTAESRDTKIECRGLLPLLKAMENPATRAAELNKRVDEIRGVVVENVSDLLERGEHIDAMVERADGLSTSTRVFYKETKKLKKCGWASCQIL